MDLVTINVKKNEKVVNSYAQYYAQYRLVCLRKMFKDQSLLSQKTGQICLHSILSTIDFKMHI